MENNKKKGFTLGEQPDWAGTEDVTPKTIEFMEELLKESTTSSLICRGYVKDLFKNERYIDNGILDMQ